MPPGETAVWAVLVETLELAADGEDGADVSRVWFEQIGYVTVPKGTQRSTVQRKVLEQGDGVPVLPLGHGETARLHLVPALELGESVPIVAHNRLIFEVVA